MVTALHSRQESKVACERPSFAGEGYYWSQIRSNPPKVGNLSIPCICLSARTQRTRRKSTWIWPDIPTMWVQTPCDKTFVLKCCNRVKCTDDCWIFFIRNRSVDNHLDWEEEIRSGDFFCLWYHYYCDWIVRFESVTFLTFWTSTFDSLLESLSLLPAQLLKSTAKPSRTQRTVPEFFS